MKKVLLFLFLIFIPLFLKAETCDIEKISIESISIVDSNGSSFEKTDAIIDGNKINLDLSMSNVGDSITYKIDVKNDSDDDFELDDSSIESKSEYIEYSFNNNNSVTVNAHSTKVVNLKVEYKNPIPASVLVGDTYNDNEDLVLSLSTFTNPKTGNNVAIVLLIALVASSLAYLLFNKKIIPSVMVIVIGLIVIIPVVINAICKIDIEISSNVEIIKIAEFDKGGVVNLKVRKLAGWVDMGPMAKSNNSDYSVKYVTADDDDFDSGVDVIKSFKRSKTLPDDIKVLVDSQIEEANNIDVTDDVNQKIQSINNNCEILSNFELRYEGNDKLYCEIFDGEEYCHSELDLKNWLRTKFDNTFIVDNETYKYLVYDKKNDVLNLYSEEDYKNYLTKMLSAEEKENILKNVLSSEDSNYIIYGWFDEDTKEIYYYCEKELVYLNEDSSSMFANFKYVKSIPGLLEADASRVKDMSYMFINANIFSTNISSLDTSKVENMKAMFSSMECNNSNNTETLNISGLNVSNVIDMSNMFQYFGSGCSNPNINISGWDTSKVEDMSNMFANSFRSPTVVDLDFTFLDVSSVKDMSNMFERVGEESQNIKINVSGWNSSKVEDMSAMFAGVGSGYYVSNVEINASNMNTSNVKNMTGMFTNAGSAASATNAAVTLNLSNWDTKNVENMNHMFYDAGRNAKTISIIGLSNFNTSKVTDMTKIFYQTGEYAQDISLDISSWDTSNITDMSSMFYSFGTRASTINLNLSNWNVSKVTNMDSMLYGVGKEATTWRIGDLSNWNVSNVENMRLLFWGCGGNTESFSLGNLSNWNVSKVTDMNYMFAYTGQNSTSWYVGDLSNWDTRNVTIMDGMFRSAGKSATNWNSFGTLKVYASDIKNMFLDSNKAQATLNIYSNPTSYTKAFQNVATSTGASITVNYSNITTNIDAIINTKSTNSTVTKGVLLD